LSENDGLFRSRKVILLFGRLLAIFFLLLLVGSLAITLDGQYDNLHVADLAVVLGSKVRADGQPSEMLKARLNHTAELYREGYFKFVLVSGGRGKEGYDEPVVMRHYLEGKAVPHESIFEDDQGYTTWRTAQNTAAFLKTHHLKSVLIISQYFHLPRCRLAFAKFGIERVYWSHAPFWSLRDFYSVPREVLGTCVYSWRPARPAPR
jgi:vancomycin permeability regulator SanA